MQVEEQVAVIRQESERLAAVAGAGPLDVRIPACPDWSMADLLRHLVEVHGQWAEVVEVPLASMADVRAFEEGRPPGPADDQALDTFRREASRLADVLGAADPGRACWTWGPEQSARFVQAFQVQEISLHRVDAEQARGIEITPLHTGAALDGLDVLADVLTPGTEHAQPLLLVPHEDPGRARTLFSGNDATEPVATVQGAASDLVLAAWRRTGLGAVRVDGDRHVVEAALTALVVD